jgi:hypothetical protein
MSVNRDSRAGKSKELFVPHMRSASAVAIDSIEKTALIQFANEAVFDKIIDIHLADARSLRFSVGAARCAFLCAATNPTN